jgi:hypothetical protein
MPKAKDLARVDGDALVDPPRTAASNLPSPMDSFDAAVWAKSFVDHVAQHPSIPTDEETMLAWFASAIMRGWDEHARRYPDENRFNANLTALPAFLVAVINAIGDISKTEALDAIEKHWWSLRRGLEP